VTAADLSKWTKSWNDNMTTMSRVSDVGYWNKRAEDYDDFIKTSQFEYGREIARILYREDVLRPGATVLEIAGGVGAVTLPLASHASRITTLEPAKKMAGRLKKNAADQGISNIEVKICTLSGYDKGAQPKSVDLTVICHASWQFPNIEKLFQLMDRISRRSCCLCDTVPNILSSHQAMCEKLGIDTGAFDRALCLYNLLCETRRCPGISFFHYRMRRSTASAMSMWTHLVGKYRETTKNDVELIGDHVSAHEADGIYEEPACMAVMWWNPKEALINE
jgi:ubiquinone/menaquinone biosynthesis C-methylase UbiE